MHRKIKFFALLLCICFVAISATALWSMWADNAIQETYFTVESNRLPTAFGGFRIAHVSDLHNDTLGDNNDSLILKLKKAKPDIIAVTGDLIDCRTPDTAVALSFMERALQLAPVYYVTGNHETALYDIYPAFERQLRDMGVTVLNNEAVTLTENGQTITLLGLSDPNSETLDSNGRVALMQSCVQEEFTIVLSHRPEIFDDYAAAQADLVLTGHAHGGQFRLPYIGGLYAPGQGLLPVYDAGLFESGNTVMYISRGVGNSLFPLRFNNRPELPVITLQTAAIG